jgi:hypothetical protein
MSPPTSNDANPSRGNPVLATTPLSQNNMDTPEHQSLYEAGLAMRKQVVGEDYVATALEKGSSDFLRPLQQLATVLIIISSPLPLSERFYKRKGDPNLRTSLTPNPRKQPGARYGRDQGWSSRPAAS